MRKEYVFWENGSDSLLYHIPTIRFFRVYDKDKAALLNDYLNRKMDNEVAVTELSSISQALNETKSNSCIVDTEVRAKDFTINRLALVLTNECNLRCKYCYANHGKYEYEDFRKMSDQTAMGAVDFFMGNFRKVQGIQFFGGEPALCKNEIFHIIEYIDKLNECGKISYKPKYSIVTNGTCLDEDLIKVLVAYNFNITISIDGDRVIHDKLRTDSSDSGTFEKIYSNYRRLIEFGLEEKQLNIEATYTNEHLENDVSIVELIAFFNDRFKVSTPHITFVNVDDKNHLSLVNNVEKHEKYLKEAIGYMFDSILGTDNIKATRMLLGTLTRLITKTIKDDICPAGRATFSVAPDGNITPCFMYTSQKDLAYGSVYDDPDKILNKALEFDSKVNKKANNQDCAYCFARTVCSSCLGEFNIIGGNCIAVSSKVYCHLARYLTKECLLKLAEIKGDSLRWEKLISRIS